MNIVSDLPARPAPFAPMAANHGAEGQGAGRIDWYRLRARLAATRSADTLGRPTNSLNPALSWGSFDRVSARKLAGYGIGQGPGQGGVNPTGLGHGNSRCGNDAAVAGFISAGGRG
jgi:hypothetical protein